MVSRPRSHVLGDLAVSRLIQEITALGWTYERISQDYGEDLLIRIFEAGKATPYFFFVQSKSTDNIERYRNKFGEYRYPLNRRHVKQWLSYQQPVVVTLYDSKSDRFVWQEIQQYMGYIWEDKNSIRSSILFPPNKILNKTALETIATIAAYKYDLLDERNRAARELEGTLQEHYGLTIEYNPDGVVILPKGKFVPNEPAEKTVVLFGRTLATLENIQSRLGVDDTQKVFEKSISVMADFVTAFAEGGTVKIVDSEGVVRGEFSTFEEFSEYLVAHSSSSDSEHT